ncbi:hypothetical protein [Streptomyces canus]|uniref:hypothetical protein n=1 Tax=Streptomyces canus TaxID=58343 RepID=UPI0037FA4A76
MQADAFTEHTITAVRYTMCEDDGWIGDMYDYGHSEPVATETEETCDSAMTVRSDPYDEPSSGTKETTLAGGPGGRHGAVTWTLPEPMLAAPVSDPVLPPGWAGEPKLWTGFVAVRCPRNRSPVLVDDEPLHAITFEAGLPSRCGGTLTASIPP